MKEETTQNLAKPQQTQEIKQHNSADAAAAVVVAAAAAEDSLGLHKTKHTEL
jgi:aspartate oxidase